MLRFKTPHLLASVLLTLVPATGIAESHYCIAVNGGFGHGGTTFVGTGFSLPSYGNCIPWVGFAKTASTVVLTTTGTGCVSTDGKVLTVSVVDSDPSYFGPGVVQADSIRLTRSSTSTDFGTGMDSGYFGASAKPTSCTSSLLSLPHNHD